MSDHALDYLSAVAGLLAFAVIGFRADVAHVRAIINRDRANTPKWRKYANVFVLALPYIAFIAAIGVFIYQHHQIHIRHHIFKLIQAQAPIDLQQPVEVSCTNEHFRIKVSGAVFGPDLRQLKNRYHGVPVKVYAVVEEETSFANKRGLVWVQDSGVGTLDKAGDYTVEAFLGGKGPDAAKEGQVFLVRAYIPKDQSIDFSKGASFDPDYPLPDAVFLSEPIYIKCHRPQLTQN